MCVGWYPDPSEEWWGPVGWDPDAQSLRASGLPGGAVDSWLQCQLRAEEPGTGGGVGGHQAQGPQASVGPA